MHLRKEESLSNKISKTEKEIKSYLEQAKCTNKVILIGNTGAGKTTISCILSGKPVKVIPVRRRDAKLEFPGIKEGGNSETTTPNIMVDPASDILYGDCPGFEDSNGPEQEIINAFAINYLLTMFTEGNNKIKILLVIGADEISATRAKSILQNFQRIEEMFPDKKQLQNSVGIIFTRAEPSKEGIDYVDQLSENAKPLVQQWCEFFMEHEDRLFTLPKVTRAEADKEYIYANKNKLIEFLTKDQLINPVHHISLSETAKNDLEKEFNERREKLDDLLTLIFETIYSSINKIEKLENANEWSNVLQKFIQLEIHDINELKNALTSNLNSDCLSSLANYLKTLDDFEAFDSFISQAINIKTNNKIQKIFRSKSAVAISQLNLIKQHIQTMQLREQDLQNQKKLLERQEQITNGLKDQLNEQKNEAIRAQNRMQKLMDDQKNEANRAQNRMQKLMDDQKNQLKSMTEQMSLYQDHEMTIKKKPKKYKYPEGKNFIWIREEFNMNNDDNKGLLCQLYDEIGGNLHDKGIIEITSNSINGSSFEPRNLGDFYSNNSYASTNYEHSYFIIDLIDHKIQIHDYVIRNPDYRIDCYLKDWKIQGSNDKNNWDLISSTTFTGGDEIGDCTHIHKAIYNTKNFYRYIRLMQTGESYHPKDTHEHVFGIRFIDFYGKLLQP